MSHLIFKDLRTVEKIFWRDLEFKKHEITGKADVFSILEYPYQLLENDGCSRLQCIPNNEEDLAGLLDIIKLSGKYIDLRLNLSPRYDYLLVIKDGNPQFLYEKRHITRDTYDFTLEYLKAYSLATKLLEEANRIEKVVIPSRAAV